VAAKPANPVEGQVPEPSQPTLGSVAGPQPLGRTVPELMPNLVKRGRACAAGLSGRTGSAHICDQPG